jgi:hypothetical protein
MSTRRKRKIWEASVLTESAVVVKIEADTPPPAAAASRINDRARSYELFHGELQSVPVDLLLSDLFSASAYLLTIKGDGGSVIAACCFYGVSATVVVR